MGRCPLQPATWFTLWTGQRPKAVLPSPNCPALRPRTRRRGVRRSRRECDCHAAIVRASASPFHGRVENFDMRQAIDAATVSQFEQAIDRYAVLVFPAQPVGGSA